MNFPRGKVYVKLVNQVAILVLQKSYGHDVVMFCLEYSLVKIYDLVSFSVRRRATIANGKENLMVFK